MKKILLVLFIVLISALPILSQPFTIFSENMGSIDVSSNTAISSHTGFQQYGIVNYSGASDVRITTASTGSGGNNIFLSNTGTANFNVSNINIDGASSMNLKFLIHKNTTAENGASLKINISIDGQTPVPLSFVSLNTGSGTTGWYPVSVDLSAYSGALLSIDFSNSSTANSNYFRIDDVQLISDTKLPIVFGNLKGFIKDQQLKIQWEMLQEENSRNFEIQVSDDGEHFKTIQTIASKALLVNSSQAISYDFTMDFQHAMGMLSIFGISILGIRMNRKNRILQIVINLIVIIAFVSCQKSNDINLLQKDKLFARVVHVDQFGKRMVSKTILISDSNH
ncbi:MAG: carbohydrate-binding protein [Chitinophagaceae bacterium]|nr:MAG: carbohydrate-binding protein [Chitinophagaceae bacterium]